MPERVGHMIETTIASEPDVQMIYVKGIRADAYYLAVESGSTKLFVHPIHEAHAEACRKAPDTSSSSEEQ